MIKVSGPCLACRQYPPLALGAAYPALRAEVKFVRGSTCTVDGLFESLINGRTGVTNVNTTHSHAAVRCFIGMPAL